MPRDPQERPPALNLPFTIMAGCIIGGTLWIIMFPALRWLCLTVDALISRFIP